MTDRDARQRECYPTGIPPYPPAGTYEVEIDVHIRCAATGEVRVYHDTGLVDIEGDRFSDYIWEEGNFSCDCNRRIFFRRAGNEDEGGMHTCGQDAYVVEKIVRCDTGTIVYADDQ